MGTGATMNTHRVLVVTETVTDVTVDLDEIATVDTLPAGELTAADVDDADCVVADDTAVRYGLPAATEVPVVAFGDDPNGPLASSPIADAFATDPESIRAQVKWLLVREEDDSIRRSATTPSRTERLHEGAAELTGVRSEREAFETTVTVAEEVLSLHYCTVGLVEGSWITPVAVSTDIEISDCSDVKVGEGVAGEVYRTGEPRLDRDLGDDELGGDYGSAITVPVGNRAVFQAVATDTGAFDPVDLELVELLVSHLEETLRRISADEKLRTERDRLQALFENVPDAAIHFELVDDEPIVQRVNSEFESVFGYDEETVLGESADEFVIPQDPEYNAEADSLNQTLREGKSLRTEVKRLTTDGLSHFILHVIPLQLDAENVSGYAIYTDMTDHREREAQLRRKNERLDEFAAIVSHDLRNPLSVATGYLDLARETDDPVHLDQVDDALHRMDRLIDDLLTLAREGAVVGDRTEAPLSRLAHDAWENVETPDATLEVDVDRSFDVDADRVKELFENLFRNSIEHGDDPQTISVGLTDAGFYVADDGPGIPPESREEVFETGYSTGGSGTGLGLAIVRSIAQAHDWSVEATESSSGGARFEFHASS